MIFIIDSIDEGIARCEMPDGSFFSIPASFTNDAAEGTCLRIEESGDISISDVTDDRIILTLDEASAAVPLSLYCSAEPGDRICIVSDKEEEEHRRSTIKELEEELFSE